MSINKEKNTHVYCMFSKNAYEFMRRYSDFSGSSISDFVRQAVAEKIMKLGDINEIIKRC